MKRWRQNIGREKIRSANGIKVKDTWMQIVGVAKNVELRDEARSSEVILLCAGAPELFCREHLAHPDAGKLRPRSANALAREVHALDPTLAPCAAIACRRQVDRNEATPSDWRSRCSRFSAGWRCSWPQSDFTGSCRIRFRKARASSASRMALGAGVRRCFAIGHFTRSCD